MVTKGLCSRFRRKSPVEMPGRSQIEQDLVVSRAVAELFANVVSFNVSSIAI
jgi:hypothetical protein